VSIQTTTTLLSSTAATADRPLLPSASADDGRAGAHRPRHFPDPNSGGRRLVNRPLRLLRRWRQLLHHLLLPCITFGQIAEIVDKGATTSCGTSGALYALIMYVTCCQCLYSCFYRSKLRAQLGLREEPCADCLVHCCCETCSLCQMYRELNRRGFDMSIGRLKHGVLSFRAGWHANMERQGQPATIPPPVQGMSR
ncbi:unnamed protein product, partial [Musa textilis]